VLVEVSEQALADCSWPWGNAACDGGLDSRAYEWIMEIGFIPTEESYPCVVAPPRAALFVLLTLLPAQRKCGVNHEAAGERRKKRDRRAKKEDNRREM
jgi:hypothetical protein